MAKALQNNVLLTFTNWFLNGFYMVSIWSPFDFHSSSLPSQSLFVCFEQTGTQQTRTRICFVHIN